MGAFLPAYACRPHGYDLACRGRPAVAGLRRPAQARGPEAIADVAEQVIDAVVNISTKQSVDMSDLPQLPPDSPLGDLFKEFKKRQGENGGPKRRVNSLGSGFIIDPAGYVVTNNHVIADSDEVDVILNDGTTLRAKIVGRDTKVDLALLKVKPPHPLKAVKFGNSDKLRLGEWVIAIGNPFSLGGTVTAGIVSARNRDIRSGPVRQLHPDRRRHQSRQFGRAAVQSRGRGDRRQHRDHLAVGRLDRHRLRGAVEHRACR